MFEKKPLKQKKEIGKLYEKYREILHACRDGKELLKACASMYEEMERINERNGYWDSLKGFNSEAVYYIAEFAFSERRTLFEDLEKTKIMESEENLASEDFQKKRRASILHKYICDSRKIRVHVIEPHHDDALGSACGICYNDNVITTLHTMCQSKDERDEVNLDKKGRKKYKNLKRDMNIAKHEKYMLPDFHYNLRIQDKNMEFGEKAEKYKAHYSSLDVLRKHIFAIFQEAEKEGACVSFPIGLEHPMHILTMMICMEYIEKMQFDKGKVIIYVDHPYDFQLMGTGRMMEVKEFLESLFSMKLLRCDDMGVEQYQMQKIIREIYGDLHHGEFEGSLDRTLCSYYITGKGYEFIRDYFKLQCNNILYISVQAWPFYKTGGLGEVAYGYCKALQSAVNDVRILIPGYMPEGGKEAQGRHLAEFFFTYEHSDGDYECEIEKREFNGIIYYLMKMQDSNGTQIDFRQVNRSGKEFAVFCDAILQKGLNVMDYFPTICHCNDWQTALLPLLKKTKYRNYRRDLKMVYTIHFYGYKGIFSKKGMMSQLGIKKEECDLCIVCREECILDKIDLLNKTAKGELLQMPPSLMSCMRAGIEFSDAVTTVSKGYAEEIQNYPDFADVKVVGIRNGIISLEERLGEQQFHELQSYEGLKDYKRDSKKKLQRGLGLEINEKVPIVCMVTRLAVEKGIELVKTIIPFLLDEELQMVIVGDDSDKKNQTYANYFKEIEKENEGRFAYRAYSEQLEYVTYAGADILLMPSLSEACGTTQMNAMQLGVIPIVSMLSSFKDTVLDYKHLNQRASMHWDKGIGFYAYKDDCWVFLEILKKVLEIYHAHPEEWEYISQICSKTDFSWRNGSVYKYVNLYNELRNRE